MKRLPDITNQLRRRLSKLVAAKKPQIADGLTDAELRDEVQRSVSAVRVLRQWFEDRHGKVPSDNTAQGNAHIVNEAVWLEEIELHPKVRLTLKDSVFANREAAGYLRKHNLIEE